MLNENTGGKCSWLANKLEGFNDGPAGWIYLQFPKPLKLCGFGLRSAEDSDRDPKNWRVFLRKPLAEDLNTQPRLKEEEEEEDPPNY